ncbi:transglycosylase domain-containing protein [Actinocatenispora comari]|uniref:Penicillin-binding protein n=1 Tax=Actinocatenispora comari TaxID=2807577 RepID=A0A8J4AFI0_9ACTN|nr:transglycosylase domain-containing protein [Actinocatenispora comari]GIL29700.1 penicillin-binding protein [Actinocatenispora comari]
MRRQNSLLGDLASLLVCGVLAGIVVALLAFPGFGVSGLAVKSGTGIFTNKSDQLKIPPPPQNSYLYANDGKTLITTFYSDNRTPTTIGHIPTVMQRAIVAAEDTRFYHHHGVDPRGVVRALLANRSAGQVSEGASTLTMQYVRNVRIYSAKTPQELHAATEQSMARKIQEMRYALALERKLSKKQIMQGYLNIVYFGHQAYGIVAASKVYFDTTPDKLTLPQAALLAGVVKSPDAFDPESGPAGRKAALVRRSYVLDSMAKLHYISKAEAKKAKAAPIGLHPSSTPNGCTEVPSKHKDWGFFCDWFVQWWDQQEQFGATSAARENLLRTGGYKIVTSMDPKVQASARKASLAVYSKTNTKALPIAAIQPGTGRVVAMSVNRDYSLKKNPDGMKNRPNTVDQLVAGGGDVNGYQTGSTFKMFTMLAALESGLPLDTGFHAPSPLRTNYIAGNGYYSPVNDNPKWMDGYRTMWDGYGRSVNTYFVWLEQKIGAEKAVNMAKRLGIKFRAHSDAVYASKGRADGWGAFTLGVAQTTPLDLANAYATVAAEGIYCKELPVASIVDARGHASDAAKPQCHRAVSRDVARAATDAARCPVGQQGFYHKCNGGTAPEVGRMFGSRPLGGKTGSSETNATESFVGFTPQIAAAATACTPDNPWDSVGAGISSSVDVAVAKTMLTDLSGQPIRGFHKPSSHIAYG